jgi:hypothetical protein
MIGDQNFDRRIDESNIDVRFRLNDLSKKGDGRNDVITQQRRIILISVVSDLKNKPND